MGLTDLLTRSIENPAVPLGEADWQDDVFGGTPSHSGIRVTPKTALEYAPLWRGVNLLSRDVAKLGCHIFGRLPDLGENARQRDTKHPAYRLLRTRPNDMMSAFMFFQTVQAHAIIHGNGYALVSRDGGGRPIELIPMVPPKVTMARDPDGRFFYRHEDIEEALRPEDVIHIKGLSDDGLTGLNLIDKARNSMGLGLAAEKYGNKFFANNARPAVILEHPTHFKDDRAIARLKTSWANMAKGLDNAHGTAVLEDGITARILGISGRDAQLIQTRQFEIIQVANWVGVPPHKLGATVTRSYSSLEQENRSYLDESLDAWLVAWEQELTDKLLTEAQKRGDTHFIEFNRNALVRADMPARFAGYASAIEKGWMSPNEARARENMNPVEGLDEFVPVGGPPEEPPAEEDEEDDGDTETDGDDDKDEADRDADIDIDLRQTHLRMIVEVVQRMAKRVGVGAQSAARASLKSGVIGAAYFDWLDDGDGLENTARVFADLLRDPVRAFVLHDATDEVETLVRIVDGCVNEWRETFLKAANAKPDDFQLEVGRAALATERDAAALAAALITGRKG